MINLIHNLTKFFGGKYYDLRLWLSHYFCKHKETHILYIDYPDRFIKEECKNCGTVIYKDLD